ncbi:ATP-binding protein [Sphingobacterium sp. B16(2022)]|uniref:ATP-binding protein n=1 Tax=Sphingobacterium sp. B16(2022) TaxID=2914044 RepID=UPI0019D2C06F|nr:ATP-binding protein [Sphingobacterium sp. B16(2022)]
MKGNKINPFSHEYFIGYINQVLPQFIKVHFPSSVLLNGFTHQGEEFNGGLVGNFLVIEGDNFGFLGRLVELMLPEKERLSLSEKSFQTKNFHPEGKIEILLSFDLYNPYVVKKGLSSYPNIGAKVYVCSSDLVKQFMSRFGAKEGEEVSPVVLGRLVANRDTEVHVNLQSLFGRHCAIVGTTGGGKSYTVSKLLEVLSEKNAKAIIIDATGEYSGAYKGLVNVNIGDGKSLFHYSQLRTDDLFNLFKPSSKTQAPKLMEAIRSLKIVHLTNGVSLQRKILKETVETLVSNGLLKKSGSDKRPYERYYYENISVIENGMAEFDIEKLPFQISQECVWDCGSKWEGTPRAKIDIPEKWGDRNESDVSYNVSLISRINNIINSPVYQNLFGFKKKKDQSDISNIIEDFIKGDQSILRLNFENVPFDFQVREILANSIGSFLLNKARKGDFKKSPLTIFMDEAHQFLNKSVGSEFFDGANLDAFDSIAKECRKHGLFLCIATQMPRDIPQGTLSQMGTFIVHRLINHFDKEAISNACSSANRNTLDFLPILGEGEAILTGVDFPMPIILKIDEPNVKPDSRTPKI